MYGYIILHCNHGLVHYIAGSDITSYIVTLERGFFDFDTITVGADVRSALFTGLAEGTTYT